LPFLGFLAILSKQNKKHVQKKLTMATRLSERLYDNREPPSSQQRGYGQVYADWQPDTPYVERHIGCPATFTRYNKPVRVNGFTRATTWTPDLNYEIMMRSRAVGAEQNPYKHHNRRQRWMQSIMKDMSMRTDRYTKQVNGPDETLHARMNACGGQQPDFYKF
jgi:hypothetical protein